MRTQAFAWMSCPCGLSITEDIMNDVPNPSGEVPYQLLSWSCFYCLSLITAAPL